MTSSQRRAALPTILVYMTAVTAIGRCTASLFAKNYGLPAAFAGLPRRAPRLGVGRFITPGLFPPHHALRHYHRLFAPPLFAESESEAGAALDESLPLDVPGLRKETDRLILRCQKKLVKANDRLSAGLSKWSSSEEYLTAPDPSSLATPETVSSAKEIIAELRDRLAGLNDLQATLAPLKGKTPPIPDDALSLIASLGVSDAPPVRAPQGPKKTKGPARLDSTRLPYRRFYSEDGTEIRVGKSAPDNDVLSTDPVHRDGRDWWMHASGCPGSHVVIRCHEELGDTTVADAAALAASYSRFKNQRTVKVNLCKCRDVSKPFGAKPGLVMLRGDTRTVKVDTREGAKRIERLDKTCLVN